MSEEDVTETAETGCGDAPLYALGLLDDQRAERFRLHADGCAVCRDEIAALVPVVDALACAAPPMRAPRRVRRRLMREVRAESAALAPGAHAAVRARSRGVRRMALAAGATALLGTGVALGTLLSGPGGGAPPRFDVRVTLRGLTARVQRSGNGEGRLTYAHLPAPQAGNVYEMWLQRSAGGPPQPTTALFVPDASGSGSVTVPGGLRGVSAVMVTSEPAGGSLTPTSSPIIVARLG